MRKRIFTILLISLILALMAFIGGRFVVIVLATKNTPFCHIGDESCWERECQWYPKAHGCGMYSEK